MSTCEAACQAVTHAWWWDVAVIAGQLALGYVIGRALARR